MTTWRKLIDETLVRLDDGPLISCTLSEKELDTEFDASYGSNEGLPFTAWTNNFVLFPITYDGSEWAGAAPRNPCDLKMDHQGGN